MLDVVRLGRGGTTQRRREVALHDLVGKVVAEIQGSAEPRRQTFVVDVAELPLLGGDAASLSRALHHLVVNAVKFTPDGGTITIRGRCVGPEVELVVEDTGIGIDRGEQELIFETFYRTGDARHHSSGRTKFKGGGPGLGLPLARRIVEAHGGRLWVESAGHDEATCPGSRFHVSLPLERA
jgi:signal transduction histidine kinase